MQVRNDRPLYHLFVPDEVADLIRTMHPDLKKKVKAILQALLLDPFLGKALRDELEGLRSSRVSNYRVVYRVSEDRLIEIVAIGPRVSIYGDTLRLIQRKPRTGNGYSRYRS